MTYLTVSTLAPKPLKNELKDILKLKKKKKFILEIIFALAYFLPSKDLTGGVDLLSVFDIY